MTAAIRKQIERSRQAQDGRKRIEAVLDRQALSILEALKEKKGWTSGRSISHALMNLPPIWAYEEAKK